ncbi:hypothetical protein LTS10_002724 [Elasticomyces elasticus]|nr:hypothetical protein LTS10_002724 [Elasticomyces elasticus]
MTLTPTEGPTTNSPDQGHQAVSLTIQEAYTRFNRKFIKACYATDMNGSTSGALLEFLDQVKGVPYYEMKVYIALGTPGEEDEEWGNINACGHFLD